MERLPFSFHRLNEFKYMISVSDLTQTEKDYLATVDINNSAVDNYIRKATKKHNAHPDNLTRINVVDD